MSTESKKHHFVPRSVLRNFQNSDDTLFVFDKWKGNVFRSNADDAGHENAFNTVAFDKGEKLNFEEVYQVIDSKGAIIINKILQSDRECHLSIEEYYDLCYFTITQMLRTKLQRTTVMELTKDTKDWFNSMIPDSQKHKWEEMQELNEEQSKLLSIISLQDTEELVELLLYTGVIIQRTSPDVPFWIGDNPVVMHNGYPYGRSGLKVPGTHIYYPISSGLTLCFMCRNDCDKIEKVYDHCKLQNLPVPEDILDLYEAIFKDRILNVREEHVLFANSLQISNSSRFLYGSNSNFSLAEMIIKDNPELKEIRTKLTVDNPVNTKLPEGTIVVFFLEDGDHFMIQAHTIESKVDFEFKTTDIVKLTVIFQNKSTISRIEIYKDGILTRSMAEVRLKEWCPIKGAGRIAHVNNAFSAIIEHFRAQKRNSANNET